MCRFVYYHGSPIILSTLISQPDHSLIDQSQHAWEREEPINGDGFGVSWYDVKIKSDPAIFRSVSPAWSNSNLLELADMVSSHCILAHVRAATSGGQVNHFNCHPFKWENFAFMHNGIIGGFHQIKKRIIGQLSEEAFSQIGGNTDSEFFFAMIIDELIQDERIGMYVACRRALDKLNQWLMKLEEFEPTHLNFVLADGQHAVVARITNDQPEKAQSLYYNEGHRYVCQDGVCHMMHDHFNHEAIIFSSEPLNSHEPWTKVAPNQIILLDGPKIVTSYHYAMVNLDFQTAGQLI